MCVYRYEPPYVTNFSFPIGQGEIVEVNGTIIVQMIIFVSLLMCLSRLLFAPLLKLFDERERRIDLAKNEALTLSKMAEEKAREFEVRYKTASETARHALSHVKSENQKIYQEELRALREEANEAIKRAQSTILKEEAKVREDLLAQSEALADEIIGAVATRT